MAAAESRGLTESERTPSSENWLQMSLPSPEGLQLARDTILASVSLAAMHHSEFWVSGALRGWLALRTIPMMPAESIRVLENPILA